MTQAKWRSDDPSVPDDEVLARRIHRRPDFAIIDSISRVAKVLDNAVQLDDDGISSYACSMVDDPKDLCNWETHAVYLLMVEHVREPPESTSPGEVRRPSAGVVPDPQDEPPVGHAHHLIRPDRPKSELSRHERKALRVFLADRALIYNSAEEMSAS